MELRHSFNFRKVRGIFLASILASLLAACGANSSSGATAGNSTTTGNSTSTSSCTAGNQVINGISTQVFCGTAKGQATIDGQTYTFTNGLCFNNQAGLVGVNIGHEVIDPTNSAAGTALTATYDYLGIEAQATKDGTYPNSFIAGNHHTIDLTGMGTVTFSNNLQAGTFTGKTTIDGKDVTGSWTC